MKTILIILCACFLLSGCEDHEKYPWDKGYSDAWEGRNLTGGLFESEEKKQGYEQGLVDSEMYDIGWYDGWKSRKPKFPKDVFYMDGYKEGKKRH